MGMHIGSGYTISINKDEAIDKQCIEVIILRGQFSVGYKMSMFVFTQSDC